MSGGAKPYNPHWSDVDRIVDYATALESALVPEKDYNRRRISHRAAALIRAVSQIVHGSRLGSDEMAWLYDNWGTIELRVRQVLTAAVRELPPAENARRAALAALYDLTDDDRGSFAFEKFREIRTAAVRNAIASRIASVEF